MNLKYKLPTGYSIRDLATEEFKPLWQKPGMKIFNNTSLFYDGKLVHTDRERAHFKKLRENFQSEKHLQINLALFYRNRFVGWSWGIQETPTVFYMCNSAVLKAHRRKGLYTCLLKEMLSRATEKGFAKIYSRHSMTNNDVIIAKLKQGFKITSFELSDAYGSLVHLTYYPSKTKNEILDFRSGYRRPNSKMKKIFQL